MCIALFTTSHPGYKLYSILASNRDEFHDRPASLAAWHDWTTDAGEGAEGEAGPSSAPAPRGSVLSGVDLSVPPTAHGGSSGGTWLGMTRDLRIGVLTNIRPPSTSPTARKPGAPSRGALLRHFLAPASSSAAPAAATTAQSPSSLNPTAPPHPPPLADFLASPTDVDLYDGFNLLLFQPAPASPSSPSRSRPMQVGYITNRASSLSPSSASTVIPPQPNPTAAQHEHEHVHDADAAIADPCAGAEAQRAGRGRAEILQLAPGAHGLSNTTWDAPWPKVVEGCAGLEAVLREWEAEAEADDPSGRGSQDAATDGAEDRLRRETALVDRLMHLLSSSIPVRSPADAPRSIRIPTVEFGGRAYGTRTSTVVLVSETDEVVFVERTFGPRTRAASGADSSGAEGEREGDMPDWVDRRYVFQGQGIGCV